ncbi:universal stress protein [Streptomyces sp. NPDC006450]|uniref:universal stress protein n=1 Tax=Streptomyces sp. NPDC006450 TaxID=3155458 RepID=UPI0033B07584
MRRPASLPRGGGPARRAARACPVRPGRPRPRQCYPRPEHHLLRLRDAARRGALQVVAHAWPARAFTTACAITTAGHEETANAHEVTALAAAHLRPYAERFPEVGIEQVSAPGDAAGHLVAASQAADLIVIGRHRRRPLSPRLGSVTNAVLLHTGCPVAVVPLEEDAVPAAA